MRYFTTLLLLVVFGTTIAQNDPKAKEILDKIAAKVKAYPAVEVIFTMTMENKAENIKESHNGQAWMKGNMYKVNLMETENYYDGKVIYNYMPEVGEVNIKNPSEEEEGFLNPTTLFDIHNQNFDQKLISNNNGVAYIELYPKEKKNIEKIGIWVNTKDSSIQKVTSYEKEGNAITIAIISLKSMQPIPSDAFFRFDTAKYPDVEVIDMR